MELAGLFHYWVFAALLLGGLYTVIVRGNLIKKLIAMTLFQSAVFLLFIAMDKVAGGTAPILESRVPEQLYSNPLPQVLILTAIVVGIATLALGLALAVRIHESYGTLDEREIEREDDR